MLKLPGSTKKQTYILASLGVVLVGLVATIYATLTVRTPNSKANSATITLNQTNPKFGDQINFTVTNGTANDNIQVGCYQNETILVWGATAPINTSFTLGKSVNGKKDSLWQTKGGAANCYAILYQGKPTSSLANTTFKVGAK